LPSIFSRHIQSVISVACYSSSGLISNISISCILVADTRFACGISVLVPVQMKGNISDDYFRRIAGSAAAVVLPLPDDSIIFVGFSCGNETDVDVSAVLVPLSASKTLILLRACNSSMLYALPFGISTNFSSGQVLFATSSSLSGEMAVDFFSAALHCADSTLTAAMVAASGSGLLPDSILLQHVERTVFEFVPLVPTMFVAELCWADVQLVDRISGKTMTVDGHWSLFDRPKALDVVSVEMQLNEAAPIALQRHTSISVSAIIGSTLIFRASCIAPSCVLTWAVSKHFDLDIFNSSVGQQARFSPRPHHGGGSFRVC
jgi:hypothetical protein